MHGFLSLASTVLNETGKFEGEWVEMRLAHQPQGVRGMYNSATYLKHRRPMLQWWADYLGTMEAEGMLGRRAAGCPDRKKRSTHLAEAKWVPR